MGPRRDHGGVVHGAGPVQTDVIGLRETAHRHPLGRGEGREGARGGAVHGGPELACPDRRRGLHREQLGIVRAADRNVQAIGEVRGIVAAAVPVDKQDEPQQGCRVTLGQGGPDRASRSRRTVGSDPASWNRSASWRGPTVTLERRPCRPGTVPRSARRRRRRRSSLRRRLAELPRAAWTQPGSRSQTRFNAARPLEADDA